MSFFFKAESTINHVPLQASSALIAQARPLAAWRGGKWVTVCGPQTPSPQEQERSQHLVTMSPGEQSRSCSVKTANALGRAYLNWRSSRVIFTCCWPQKSNWILRKNYQATRQSCYWVSKGQGEMLITFVFREMLIWNAQRVTLSITISAYIDYISA